MIGGRQIMPMSSEKALSSWTESKGMEVATANGCVTRVWAQSHSNT